MDSFQFLKKFQLDATTIISRSAGFWSLPLNFLWKSQNFRFHATENFWDIVWHSNNHHSKALVIRKKFHCHNTWVDGLLLPIKTWKFSLGVFKKAFLEVHFGAKFSPFLRRLMFEKIYVFTISQKNIENNPYNVYIFWKGGSRAFRNRFDHVHMTFLDHSTISQSVTPI